MPIEKINGVDLYWQLTGDSGEPLVLIHGAWDDHHDWDDVVEELAKTFRVLTYDRRGHSKSERLKGQGNTWEDVDDLAALIVHLGLSPAHVVGNSFGAVIALKAAAKHPALFRSLNVHEPPLLGLITNDPDATALLHNTQAQIATVTDLIAAGKHEAAAILFMETIAVGPGAWQEFPVAVQEKFIYNAPTFYDETQDPESIQLDIKSLTAFNKPMLITRGTDSPAYFPLVMEQLAKGLPQARQFVFERAGHVPHLTHSKEFVDTVREWCLGVY